MMTSSNGNIFRVTGHLCEEFTNSVVMEAFDRIKDKRATIYKLKHECFESSFRSNQVKWNILWQHNEYHT